MLKRILLFILFIYQAFDAVGQKRPTKFGDVGMEDMSMTVYPRDSSASAVILFDQGECHLFEDLNVSFKRHVRIKFFTKESIDSWATKTLYLSHNEDVISKLKANTYNLENGKIMVSQMEETSVFETRVDKYTDQIKFTLPNVKEGAIIEYSYVLKTTASLLPSWQFQYAIPCVRSEYETIIPNTFTFKSDLQGRLKISEHTLRNNESIELWAINHVPAFKEEPFMLSPDEYVSKIDFLISELFVPGNPIIKLNRSWRGVVRNLNDDPDFEMRIKASGFLKKIIDEITTGIDDGDKKLQIIYDYVKANVSWNGYTDKIPDHPFKKVLEDKKGSSSEINLLLVSMFQKAGLNAHPVLLSTRDHGVVRQYVPMLSQFNDVICLVKLGDKKILLDATDKDLSMNALPERCLNGKGLVVSMDEMEWVSLISMRSRYIANAEYKIDESGEAAGSMSISRDGVEASAMRKSLSELGEEKYLKNIASQKGWEISNNKFENITDPNLSVKEYYHIAIRDYAQVAEAAIYLNPYLVGKMEENKFKSVERKYPVEFSTPFDRIYTAKIQIPENFTIEDLPKSKMLLLPQNTGKFVYSITSQDNTINFVSQFMISKSIFPVIDYPALREFYAQVVAKQAEQIVLKKK